MPKNNHTTKSDFRILNRRTLDYVVTAPAMRAKVLVGLHRAADFGGPNKGKVVASPPDAARQCGVSRAAFIKHSKN